MPVQPPSTPGSGCGSLKIRGQSIPVPCDWAKVQCKLGGRRLRTACRTVSDGDRAGFLAFEKGQWLHGDRAQDFYEAWGLKGSDATYEALQTLGVSKNDLAIVHLDTVVPTCLGLEKGRHTCHPNEAPGTLFYEAAREQLREDIRSGRLRWTRPPRGSGGDDPLPAPRPGQPGGPAGPPAPGDVLGGGGQGGKGQGGGKGPSAAGFGGMTAILLLGAAFLLLKGR